MARRGTTDPATVDAEMNGDESPTEAKPLSDKEWEAAKPPEDGPPGEFDDDAPRKQVPAFASEEPPTDVGPLEFFAQLLRVSDSSGSQGDRIEAQFEAPWTEVLNIAQRGKKALELRFGTVSVMGANLKSAYINTDADGALRLKVVYSIPESQKQNSSNLFMLTGKGGPLSIEPTQLSLDSLLTKRADDDSPDTVEPETS